VALMAAHRLRLFHVRDSDRPMWVIARDWHQALQEWQEQIRRENEGDPLDGPADPDGIDYVCDADDLLLPSQPIDDDLAKARELGQENSRLNALRWRAVADRDDLRDLLRDVARSGVELADERLRYVTVQVDRTTWDAVQAAFPTAGQVPSDG
jgi:hypothetical protein